MPSEGAGRDAKTVEEYVFDKALFASREAARMYVAKELGQWIEKSEYNIKSELERLAPAIAAEHGIPVERLLAMIPSVLATLGGR